VQKLILKNYLTIFAPFTFLLLWGCEGNKPDQKVAIDCACTIPNLDELVENKDTAAARRIMTLDVAGDLGVDVQPNAFVKVDAGVDIERISHTSKEMASAYIGKSNFTGNKMILELAIARTIFCATLVTYCKTGKTEKMEQEAEAFKEYILNKQTSTETAPKNLPKSTIIPKQYQLKILTGPGCRQILIDGRISSEEIGGGTDEDTKTFNVPAGKHTIRIEYYNNRKKEKHIDLSSNQTISHVVFEVL
jgi:hypothetical protein